MELSAGRKNIMAQKTGKLAILGYGREGKSVFGFIKKISEFRRAKIEIRDKKLNKNYLKNLEQFDVVFRSPGVPYNLPELKRARKSGVRFLSATKLFFDYCPTKNIIGVTGTKGKGTTSTLLHEILKVAGFDVYLAGNIGKSPLEILPKLMVRRAHHKKPWVILELSSFQLQDLEKSPRIAVVLDVFPDHQDAHLNLKEYYDAKTNIARHQRKNDFIFFFKANKLSHWTAGKGDGKKISVSENGFSLFGPADLKIRGHHNFKNAIMAATVARKLGVSPKIILKTVKSFRGLPHRLELVRSIRKFSHGNSHNFASIYFYNDSASTNPHTTATAIKAFPNEQKILIAGGQDKGLNYAPLAKSLKNSDAKLVILFGENKNKIYKAIKKSGVQIKLVKDLNTAVRLSYKVARRLPTPYDILHTVIIFSPGAASFDMFKNYADRGEQFKKIIRSLAN